MNLINLAFGFIFLIAGHQLPWLFVAGVGYFIGWPLSDMFSVGPGTLERITFSLAISAIAVFLAYFLKKLIVSAAAFYAGGIAFLSLAQILSWDFTAVRLPVFLLAGGVSALVILLSYNWSLIIISTISGATIITQNINFGDISDVAMFLLLLMVGLITQFILHQYILPIRDEVTPGSI